MELEQILTEKDIPKHIRIGGRDVTFRRGLVYTDSRDKDVIELIYEAPTNRILSWIESTLLRILFLPYYPGGDSGPLYMITPPSLEHIKGDTKIPSSRNIVTPDHRFLLFGTRTQYNNFFDSLQRYFHQGMLNGDEFMQIYSHIDHLYHELLDNIQYTSKFQFLCRRTTKKFRESFWSFYNNGDYRKSLAQSPFKGPRIFDGTTTNQPF